MLQNIYFLLVKFYLLFYISISLFLPYKERVGFFFIRLKKCFTVGLTEFCSEKTHSRLLVSLENTIAFAMRSI